MTEHMLKVRQTARLAQFRVGSLEFGSSYKSNAFKIGLWNWHLFIQRTNSLILKKSLILQNSLIVQLRHEICHEDDKGKLLEASFTVRMLVRGNDNQPLTDSYVTESNCVLRGSHNSHPASGGFIWPVDPTTYYANFLLEVEFHDLRVHSPNGVELPSIWPSEERILTQARCGIAQCLSRMLDEGLHTDVTIFTSSGSVGAHRAILASRSPVFNSMFHHDLTEKQSSKVHINDMTLESCRALLHYLYGNPEHEEFRKHRAALVRASHKYDIPDLKDACEESLLEDTDVHNVLERLHDGWLYELVRLKRECLRYLFEFGKIHGLREEFKEFLREADKDLVVELVQEQLNFLTNSWLPAQD